MAENQPGLTLDLIEQLSQEQQDRAAMPILKLIPASNQPPPPISSDQPQPRPTDEPPPTPPLVQPTRKDEPFPTPSLVPTRIHR